MFNHVTLFHVGFFAFEIIAKAPAFCFYVRIFYCCNLLDSCVEIIVLDEDQIQESAPNNGLLGG